MTGEPRVGLDRQSSQGGPQTQVPQEEAVDRRDAEELAEALETIASFDERVPLRFSRSKSLACSALSRFRSKYPKEDTDG